MKSKPLTTNIKNLVAQGKTGSAIAELEKVVGRFDDESDKEIIMIARRYRAFLTDKTSNLLSDEQEGIQLAKINGALLDIVNHLPELKPTNTSPSATLLKWLIATISFIGILVIFALWRNGVWEQKPELPAVQSTDSTKEITPNPIDTMNKPMPDSPSAERQIKTPPSSKKEKTESTTNFNGEVNVNGQVITNPTGPITIENKYNIKQDSTQNDEK